jgi:glycine oxidase
VANLSFDVAIAGGGAIGLSIGWRLAAGGQRVAVIDQSIAGRSATWASAGMLGAQAEVGFEDLDVYELGTESMRLWPDFASELESVSGVPIDYRDEGTLLVADDRDGAAHLRRIYKFQSEHGVDVEWISPLEALEIEPMLTPRISAAVYSRADHQVDSRQCARALREAFVNVGGSLAEHTVVHAIELDAERPRLITSEGVFEAAKIVLAAGAWTGRIPGLPIGDVPVRPVKGQMLEVRMEEPYVVNTVVRGQGAYLAPKGSGRLLIGATSEEMGFDEEVTAGGLYELLEKAWRMVPGTYEMKVVDSWAGLRPASPDHAPIVGRAGDDRVMIATGHYRHGILLAPVTAEAVSRSILEGSELPEMFAVCDPTRFSRLQESGHV